MAWGRWLVQRLPAGLSAMQERVRFPLTSEQCELLVAFEQAGSLPRLSELVHKDVSVLSRNLSALAESGVLEKRANRWALTALGRQVNQWTRKVANSQERLLRQQSQLKMSGSRLPSLDDATALISIGVQDGWDDPSWGARNNPQAEHNIEALLRAWRTAARPIYHVQHLSRDASSPLRPGTIGGAIKPCARPVSGEEVVRKSGNGAFAGTHLEHLLRSRDHETLMLVGFTINHCVDATARAAGDMGFNVFVVADACVSYDRVAPDGGVVRADETHRAAMANLNQEFATVIETSTVLAADEADE